MSGFAQLAKVAAIVLLVHQGVPGHALGTGTSNEIQLGGIKEILMGSHTSLSGNVNKPNHSVAMRSRMLIANTLRRLEEHHDFPLRARSLVSRSRGRAVLDQASLAQGENKSVTSSGVQKQSFHKWTRKLLEAPRTFGAEKYMDGQDRKQIVSSHYPFSAIGQFDNGCTGTLVGPCHVLTAGHCVYNPKTQEWSDKLGFTPGRTGSGAWEPRGRAEARSTNVMLGWQLFSHFGADLGLVVLDRRIGDVTGTMAFGNGSENDLLNMAGYPNDKGSGEMWYDFCNGGKPAHATSSVGYHSCTPDNGNSGSPLWVYDPSGSFREIRGVHTGVVSHSSVMLSDNGQDGSMQQPFGVMLTAHESWMLNKWINDNEC